MLPHLVDPLFGLPPFVLVQPVRAEYLCQVSAVHPVLKGILQGLLSNRTKPFEVGGQPRSQVYEVTFRHIYLERPWLKSGRRDH